MRDQRFCPGLVGEYYIGQTWDWEECWPVGIGRVIFNVRSPGKASQEGNIRAEI